MHEAPDVTEQIKHIRKHGDVIDAASSMHHNDRRIITALTQAGAIFPATFTVEAAKPLEYGIAYPAWGLGAAVVSSTLIASKRTVERHRMLSREHRQQSIRDAFDEPVDLMREGTRRNRQLILRWYGADGMGDDGDTAVDEYALGFRLQKLATAADEHDIDRIALGVDFIEPELIEDEDVYGLPFEGSRLGTKTRRGHRIDIYDNKADAEVRILTIEQARSLSELLKGRGERLLVERLIAQIGNQALLREYHATADRPELRSRFVTVMRAHVARVIDTDSFGGRVKELNERGEPTYSKRTSMHTIHPGAHGAVSVTATIVGERHTVRREQDGNTTLLDLAGAASLEALIERLHDLPPEKQDTHGLLIAAYLLLSRSDETVASDAGIQAPGAATEVDDTLFNRMTKTDKSDTMPYLRLMRGREISYIRRYGRVRRALASLLVVGGAMGAGAVGAHLVQDEANRIYFQQIKDYKDAHDIEDLGGPDPESDQFKRYTDEHQSLLNRLIMNVDHTLDDASYTVMDRTAELYEHTFPQLVELFNQYDFYQPGTYDNFYVRPDEPYADNSAQLNIGDVDTAGLETPLYAITPLTGKSSAGYWYESTESDTLVSNGSAYPFKDYQLTFLPDNSEEAVPVGYPKSEAAILRQKPDFMVNTRLDSGFAGSSSVLLPILDGYEVAGVQIYDAFDPKNHFFPQLAYQKRSHAHIVTAQGDQYSGMTRPTLRYWIKQQPTGRTTNHFDRPIDFHESEPSFLDQEFPKMTQVQQAVLKALGLGADVSDAQIMAAIRDRRSYSFHPFADADMKAIRLGDGGKIQDDTLILSNLGRTIARLESLNCNLAMTELTLATKGKYQGKYINPAMGFRNDGDGVLIAGESHAWAVNQSGAVVDATPAGNGAPKSADMKKDARDSSADDRQEQLLYGGIALATLLGATVTIRRRRQIAELSDRLRTLYATAGPVSGEAVQALQNIHYGKPGTPLSVATEDPSDPGTVARRFAQGLPPGTLSIRSLRRQSQAADRKGYDKLQGDTKRAMRRLARHQNAIRRHQGRHV